MAKIGSTITSRQKKWPRRRRLSSITRCTHQRVQIAHKRVPLEPAARPCWWLQGSKCGELVGVVKSRLKSMGKTRWWSFCSLLESFMKNKKTLRYERDSSHSDLVTPEFYKLSDICVRLFWCPSWRKRLLRVISTPPAPALSLSSRRSLLI